MSPEEWLVSQASDIFSFGRFDLRSYVPNIYLIHTPWTQNLHCFISAPQISGESAIFSPTNLEALATVEKVEDLSKQTTAIAEQAVHWLTRSTAAEKQALTFQSEADRFLKETQSTLDVVTNFDVKVAGMEGFFFFGFYTLYESLSGNLSSLLSVTVSPQSSATNAPADQYIWKPLFYLF